MLVFPGTAACSDFRIFISGSQYVIPISSGYYYQIGSSQAAWNTSNPTQVLNDGSAGDTSTSIAADYFYDGTHSTGLIALTAFYDAGSSKQVTGWQFTAKCQIGYAWVIEGSNDTTTWTSLGNGSSTATGSFVTYKYSTYDWEQFRYFRLSVYCTGEYDRLSLFDWRMTLNNPPTQDATLSGVYLGGGAATLTWTP
jgi:hypothetical protein